MKMVAVLASVPTEVSCSPTRACASTEPAQSVPQPLVVALPEPPVAALEATVSVLARVTVVVALIQPLPLVLGGGQAWS